jgi:hypothetical protein
MQKVTTQSRVEIHKLLSLDVQLLLQMLLHLLERFNVFSYCPKSVLNLLLIVLEPFEVLK